MWWFGSSESSLWEDILLVLACTWFIWLPALALGFGLGWVVFG